MIPPRQTKYKIGIARSVGPLLRGGHDVMLNRKRLGMIANFATVTQEEGYLSVRTERSKEGRGGRKNAGGRRVRAAEIEERKNKEGKKKGGTEGGRKGGRRRPGRTQRRKNIIYNMRLISTVHLILDIYSHVLA